METSMMLEVSVLVRAAPDLAGEWIAEAILVSVEDDLVHGRDLPGRTAAPEQAWRQFWEVLRGGLRIPRADLDKYGGAGALVVAAVLYMQRPSFSGPRHPIEPALREFQGPYIIAAIQDGPGAI